MNWNSVWQITLTVIASVGGAGAIICGIVKFVSERIADRLQKHYQLEVDKKLERFKADIEQTSHIRKTHFDKEFETYEELCAKFSAMIDAVHWLFPTGLDRAPAIFSDADGLKKLCDERYTTAQQKYNEAAVVYGAKAPFIEKSFLERFRSIQRIAAAQIHKYAFVNPLNASKGLNASEERIQAEGYENTEKMDQEWRELIDALRVHFEELTVRED